MVKVSIIVPCYNAEETIVEIVNEIRNLKLDHKKEIIVIDEGSTDQSISLISSFDDIKLIRHKANLGKGVAIRTDIINASGTSSLFKTQI
jgi:glycosyltransferase involved in cell wall biosynthesis